MQKGRIMIFGEVLFDVFPDGKNVLGGAPFNVAWHLQGFGESVLFVGRVGNDFAGEEIIKQMEKWRMDISGVQIDQEHPTGKVIIEIEKGEPSFSIEENQAYDFIDVKEVAEEKFGMLYHGTLALRTANAKRNLMELKKKTQAPVFLDVNLRDPWWKKEEVEKMILGSNWVKLNIEELKKFAGAEISFEHLQEQSKKILAQFKSKGIIATAGEQGACLITKDETLLRRAKKVKKLIDTVGAGDAFSAVFILGLSRGWPLATTLERSVDFAADFCQIQGATVFDRSFYQEKLKAWH